MVIISFFYEIINGEFEYFKVEHLKTYSKKDF